MHFKYIPYNDSHEMADGRGFCFGVGASFGGADLCGKNFSRSLGGGDRCGWDDN